MGIKELERELELVEAISNGRLTELNLRGKQIKELTGKEPGCLTESLAPKAEAKWMAAAEEYSQDFLRPRHERIDAERAKKRLAA